MWSLCLAKAKLNTLQYRAHAVEPLAACADMRRLSQDERQTAQQAELHHLKLKPFDLTAQCSQSPDRT